MSEKIILDRFEYKLSKDYYIVYKNSVGFKYKLKYSNKEFDSEEKCLQYIDKLLSERRRYLKLVGTLTSAKLSKLFSDEVLLGLSPAQIKEYNEVELFEYTLVVDEDWSNVSQCKNLLEVKQCLADRIGLTFHHDLDLCSDNEIVVNT